MPTKFIGTEEEVQSLNSFICLMRASDSIGQNLQNSLLAKNLTVSQFGILETLFHIGPMCQKELSIKILKSTANITTVLDNLEIRNLVKRIRNEIDKRFITVELTDSGRELITSIFPDHVSRINSLFSILSCEEKLVFQKICKVLGKQKK
jgi:MarR family transcriptional regulator, 2-MHQ and catechol-resistance regulon repressor